MRKEMESLEDGTVAEVAAVRKHRGKTARIASVVGNVLFACLLAVMLMLVFFLVQGRLAGGAPQVFGHQLYIVKGGSMSPTFEVGSLAVVRPVDPVDLAVGDIITYRGQEGSSTLTTHRIVGINSGSGLSFITRGDANDVDDHSPVAASRVVGKVVMAVPYAGYVVNFVGTREGLLSLIVVPGIIIIAFEVRNLFMLAARMDRERSARQAKKTVSGVDDDPLKKIIKY
jgi:signal peptidase